MASLKCSGCGHGIHYHGEPDGTEYVFVKLSDWEKMEKENLPSDCLECEHREKFIEAWKCSECGTFAFFGNRVHVEAVYSPAQNFSSDAMTEPTEFGVFFDDRLWYDITEDDILTSEVLEKYPQHRWLLKNDALMRVFDDRAMTKCRAEYRRIPIAAS